jgi:uncharacterized protein
MADATTKLSVDQKTQKVRDAFEAFKRGDLQAVSDSFTEDVVWHGRGSTKFGKDFKGKQATMGQIMDYAQTFQDIQMDIHDLVANDRHVVALVKTSVTKNGKTYPDEQVFVFHVNDDGRTSEAWIAADTEQLKQSLEN